VTRGQAGRFFLGLLVCGVVMGIGVAGATGAYAPHDNDTNAEMGVVAVIHFIVGFALLVSGDRDA
jgi:hypothetical protein